MSHSKTTLGICLVSGTWDEPLFETSSKKNQESQCDSSLAVDHHRMATHPTRSGYEGL